MTAFAAWCVGIVATQSLVGGVVVEHAVDVACRNAEEQPRCTKLAEVAEVVLPVGLRNYGHAVACILQNPGYHCRTKRRMVDKSIAADENHIDIVPAKGFQFLDGCWKKIEDVSLFHFCLG